MLPAISKFQIKCSPIPLNLIYKKHIKSFLWCQTLIVTMKTTTLLSLSFLLFALAAYSAPDPVLDVNGKILRPGVNYHIMPAARDGRVGGITLAATGPNNTCPFGVAQLQTDKQGLPLTFSPVDPKKGVIRLSTDSNIKFSSSNSCHQSNIWKLTYEEPIKQYFIMVGGVEGNPGRETLDNWFKIEKSTKGYKLVFCPTVCNFCKVLCRDVGIYSDGNGIRRLALSNVAFDVVFKQ